MREEDECSPYAVGACLPLSAASRLRLRSSVRLFVDEKPRRLGCLVSGSQSPYQELKGRWVTSSSILARPSRPTCVPK